MKSNWENRTLEEVCMVITDGAHNSPKSVEDGEFMASVKDFTAYGLDFSNCRKISKEDYIKLERQGCVPKIGDILVGKDGARYFEDIIIYKQNERPALLSSIAIIRPDAALITSEFLYYTFNNPLVKKDVRDNYGSGSAIPRIVLKDFKRMLISFPPLDVQMKITALLERIDSKIQINNRINDNLLHQSLCIYSEMIGSRSKDGCIGDYCSIKSGFAFKSKWWQDSGVPVIKIGSINQDCLNLSDCSYVSENKISLANDFIVGGGDLLIAMTGATIGKFTMVPKVSETILVNQRVGKFFLGDNPISRLPFIYCTLKQPEIVSEVINRGQGSAQPNISASDIMSIPCVIPPTEVIDEFNKSTSQMFELIINNQYENAVLANTRDSILPKLMSGELDVSELNL